MSAYALRMVSQIRWTCFISSSSWTCDALAAASTVFVLGAAVAAPASKRLILLAVVRSGFVEVDPLTSPCKALADAMMVSTVRSLRRPFLARGWVVSTSVFTPPPRDATWLLAMRKMCSWRSATIADTLAFHHGATCHSSTPALRSASGLCSCSCTT